MWVAAAVGPAADQEALQKVKALYAAAAYEDVLAVITALPTEARGPNVDQYRAFCLIALGQTDQAQGVIEKLVAADPSYLPDPAEMSPRVLEVFNATRQRVLPAVAKRLYSEAKVSLERKNRDEAIAGFEQLLRVIDSTNGLPELADLRVLAAGFLDLSRALPVTAAPVAAPVEAAVEPVKAAAKVPAQTTAPKAIKQDLPRWSPFDSLTRLNEFTGAVRVRVGPDGRVQKAEMVRRTHPSYDALLLERARSWTYEPALKDGVPVAADVIVEIRLQPKE
jgi:tetratricopeptide (TPR) repeat protein